MAPRGDRDPFGSDFVKPGDRLYTEEEMQALREQFQSQQEWIDRVAEFSTDAAEAADKAEKERDGLLEAANERYELMKGEARKVNRAWKEEHDRAAALQEQLEALRNFNAATRAAYDALYPASEPEASA